MVSMDRLDFSIFDDQSTRKEQGTVNEYSTLPVLYPDHRRVFGLHYLESIATR